MYDTVAQYGQALSGQVDDWHPPVMVRLWQLLHPLARTTAPMFVLQVTLYAIGFALIVAALVRIGRWRAGLAAAVLALSPLLLGWQMVVLKDTQMLGALVAAVGIVAQYRITDRPIPIAAGAVVIVLLAYATLVRSNAVFATAPFAVLMLPLPDSPRLRSGLAVAMVGVVVGLSPIINHRLLGATPSGLGKSLPMFDLAAIAVASPNSPSPFNEAERREIVARHCVKAFFWDPLGDPSACGPATSRLNERADSVLYAALAREVAAHPVAYAAHRLAHWNSTERWLVAAGLPDAAPPIEAEPNGLGLETPSSPIAASWQDVAADEAATPLGWPIAWTIISLVLLRAAWRRRAEGAGRLAFALLASGLTLEASFLIVSIASDLRYHLWPMAASALALILLSDVVILKRRGWIAASGLLSLAVAGGIFTRETLPASPGSYQGMIHSATG